MFRFLGTFWCKARSWNSLKGHPVGVEEEVASPFVSTSSIVQLEM